MRKVGSAEAEARQGEFVLHVSDELIPFELNNLLFTHVPSYSLMGTTSGTRRSETEAVRGRRRYRASKDSVDLFDARGWSWKTFQREKGCVEV